MDANKLREAIERLRKRGLADPDQLQAVCDAAEAHLATLPKTKMVEVWKIEWAFKTHAGWRPQCSEDTCKADAERFAETCRQQGHACIRVTGPHQQEIPA